MFTLGYCTSQDSFSSLSWFAILPSLSTYIYALNVMESLAYGRFGVIASIIANSNALKNGQILGRNQQLGHRPPSTIELRNGRLALAFFLYWHSSNYGDSLSWRGVGPSCGKAGIAYARRTLASH
jgi:hypothetical protein